MVHSKEIQANSTTFFIIKAFNKYICYESCFGNVVKIQGQTAVGAISRMCHLLPFLKRRDDTTRFRIFYFEPHPVNGLQQKPLPSLLVGRSNTPFEYKPSAPRLLRPHYSPVYDMIVRGARLYYCIQVQTTYFLYDDDFGDPLAADITDNTGNVVILKSGSKSNTLKIINSLPSTAIVYSLKVTVNGLVEGSDDLRRVTVGPAKELNTKTNKEKITDGTRTKLIKNEIKQRNIEALTSKR